MNIRCPSRIHGVIVDENRLEVRCSSKHCGAGGGTIVEHHFDITTGELLETKRYQAPERLFRGKESR